MLSKNEKLYERGLKEQKTDFDKTYVQNKRIFEDTIRNQEQNFVRVLQN